MRDNQAGRGNSPFGINLADLLMGPGKESDVYECGELVSHPRRRLVSEAWLCLPANPPSCVKTYFPPVQLGAMW